MPGDFAYHDGSVDMDEASLDLNGMDANGMDINPQTSIDATSQYGTKSHDFSMGNDFAAHGISQMPSIVFPDWLMDSWAQELPPAPQQPDCNNSVRHGSESASDGMDGFSPKTGIHSVVSSTASDARYPVLNSLYSHLKPNISPALACDLLDAYFVDTSPGSCVPASSLLITHIFQRSSFLSTTNPRSCSPALLSSMLLVASATTEAPFFGASPTARSQLLTRLFELTLQLLNQMEKPNKTGRNRLVDQVATFFHLALASETAQLDSFPSRWWHTAFQLAKEYRLNADIRFPSPLESDAIDIQASVVVDRTDYRFAHATGEEMEERRRLWWTLFLWDKQLALSHNSPISITSLECREARCPMPERLWQEHPAHPTDEQSSNFAFFIPFARCLELLLVRHHSRLRAQLGGASGYDATMDQSIKKQLSDLAQEVDNSMTGDLTTEERDFRYFGKVLVRILFILDARPWDIIDTLAYSNAHPGLSGGLSQVTDLIDGAAMALQDLLAVDPDISCCPLFCDVFLFIASAIIYPVLAQLQEQSPAKLITAADTFVRALESIISTTRMEHQVSHLPSMQISDLTISYSSSAKDETTSAHGARQSQEGPEPCPC